MKRIAAILLSLLLLLPSCAGKTPSESPPDDPDTEAVESSESETEEPAEPETEEPAPLFEDYHSARRALIRLEDLDLPLKYYTAESFEQFRAVRDEVMGQLNTLGEDQRRAEELYKQLKTARDALEFVRGDTPRVYIITSGGVGWGYSPCSVVVVSAEGEKYKVVSDDSAEISLRGNSTSGASKSPYNIRFSERVSLLGMDRGRKWTLLANLYDKTLMRNYIAYHLAAQMNLPYTSDCRFVEVYLNGEYRGSYNLIEPITDGRGRVEIDPENYDFLFEVDMNRNDGSYYFKPKHGQRMKVTRPEKVDSESRAVLKDFFDLLDAALMTHDMAEYSQYIDVDSFVNFYIHSELTKSIDVYDFSTRYFLKDGLLYAGPIWDYDLSMGNVSESCNEDKYFTYCNVRRFGTGSGDSAEGVWMDNYWFHELLKDPAFCRLVRERFEELFPVIENLYADNGEGRCLIDWILSRYGKSFRRNYEQAGWQELGRYSGLAKDETLPFNEEVEWLRSWFERRVAWVAFYLLELTEE
ncbi:MAG: hypothetical protein E7576_12205 [Ruminococcaceae bacterium]|jgi:hypothetical protein|nr:hypothetical protein [Oscillospiraceae bacterium]